MEKSGTMKVPVTTMVFSSLTINLQFAILSKLEILWITIYNCF